MSQIDNVILLSIDDLRADCLSCNSDKRLLSRYGVDGLVYTPNLDYYAQAGARFANCYSTSSITAPSHASMLTGLYPEKHGVLSFFEKLTPQVRSLSEILSNVGFTTFAKTEHICFKFSDLVRGFSWVDEHTEKEEQSIWEIISKNKGERNFVFLHLFDVHWPYYYITGRQESALFNDDYLGKIKAISSRYGIDLEELLESARSEAQKIVSNFDKLDPYLQESATYRSLSYLLREKLRQKHVFLPEMMRLYIEGVTKLDRAKFPWIMSHLHKLRLMENSLLIITADHGEAPVTMEGTQRFCHSYSISEGHTRVPLIFYCPQVIDGKSVIDGPVSSVDIAPTILEALGIEWQESDFDGRSLWPAICSGDRIDEASCSLRIWHYMGVLDPFGNISHSTRKFVRQRGVVRGRFKYVEMGGPLSLTSSENMTDLEFVQELYMRVLGRFGGVYEMMYWIKLLQDGFLSRSELLARFKSRMKASGNQRMLYDVGNDPFEEHNLIHEPSFQQVAADMRDELRKSFGTQRTVEGTELNERDQAEVERRLRALGYL